MKNKIFVGGISWDTDEDGLRAAFAECGAIEKVNIVYDRETGRSRGFGFIAFASEAEAATAVDQKDGTVIDGRAVRVNLAEEKKSPGQGNPRGKRQY